MYVGEEFALGLCGGEAVGVHCAQPEEGRGDVGRGGQAEEAEVFAAHDGAEVGDVRSAEGCGEGGFYARRLGDVVEVDRGGFVGKDGHDGVEIFGETGGDGDSTGGVADAGEDDLACVIGEGACGEFELDFVGDDVGLGAAVDGTDSDHGGIARVFLAADDGLDLLDEGGGDDDGIFAEVWHGAVAADATDGDVDGLRASHGGAAGDADAACCEEVGVVQADDAVGCAEALV